jgi:large subunit ribosomal protein L10
MKKLGTIFKEASESRITKNLKSSSSFFVIKYSGLSGPDLNVLRQSLRDANSELFVVRNNIARRALKDLANDDLIKLIDGPSAMVFPKDEPVAAAKALYNFAKDHVNLKLEGGLLFTKVLGKKDIEVLAKLPGRQELLTQVVCTMKSPITGLVFVLKGNLRKMVYCLEQIKNKPR